MLLINLLKNWSDDNNMKYYLENVKYKDILSYPKIEIAKEKITFLIGQSGSGKSTLLKLLNNTYSVTQGVLLYNNKPIESFDPIDLRREIIMMSQTLFLFDLTIKENFHEFYKYRDLECPTDEKITEFLHLCCADFPLDANCSIMSGGEKQRVYIAIYLSFSSKVLLLDEPTSALDEETSKYLMENITNHVRKNNLTMIVVSHNSELAEKYADDIIQLENLGGI